MVIVTLYTISNNTWRDSQLYLKYYYFVLIDLSLTIIIRCLIDKIYKSRYLTHSVCYLHLPPFLSGPLSTIIQTETLPSYTKSFFENSCNCQMNSVFVNTLQHKFLIIFSPPYRIRPKTRRHLLLQDVVCPPSNSNKHQTSPARSRPRPRHSPTRPIPQPSP
jgi:hypothetical protein